MVLFRGTQRLLDAPIIENSSSASAREIELYGVKSYSELTHKTIHILSNAHGTSAKCTMNVNNLGAKNLKTYRNGIKVDLFDGWIAINQVYAITYDGTDFLVSHVNPEDQETSTVEIFHTNSMILDLDDSATSEEITQAFEGEENIAGFQEALSTQKHIIIDISNSMGTGDYNCCYQFTGQLNPESAETVDLISYLDTENNKLITMTFVRGAANSYSSIKRTEQPLINQEQLTEVNNYISTLESKISTLEAMLVPVALPTDISNVFELTAGKYYIEYEAMPSWLGIPSDSTQYGRLDVEPYTSTNNLNHMVLKFYPENADAMYYYIRYVTEEGGSWKKVSMT